MAQAGMSVASTRVEFTWSRLLLDQTIEVPDGAEPLPRCLCSLALPSMPGTILFGTRSDLGESGLRSFIRGARPKLHRSIETPRYQHLPVGSKCQAINPVRVSHESKALLQ